MKNRHVEGALAAVLLIGIPGVAGAAVSAEKVVRVAGDKVEVTWSDADPVNVYVAESPDAGLAEAKLLAKGDRSGRIDYMAAAGSRPYFLLEDTGDQRLVKVAERALPLAQGSNFRDLGGYQATDGKRVRWGRIFRTGATPLLTEADVAQVRALGLGTLVDLRSSEERILAPTRLDGIRYTAVGYPMDELRNVPTKAALNSVYRSFPTLLAAQYRVLFETLLEDEGPTAFNCSAGQDRTGVAAALVLSALGVPRDVILADYHLSTVYRRPEYEMPPINLAAHADNPTAAFFARMQQASQGRAPQPLYDEQHRALLETAFSEIETRWGSVDAYLAQELGVTADDVAKLRAAYLE